MVQTICKEGEHKFIDVVISTTLNNANLTFEQCSECGTLKVKE